MPHCDYALFTCDFYFQDNVDMEAINDAFYLEACIYQILKHYIRDKPYYINMVELFHDVSTVIHFINNPQTHLILTLN